MFWICWFGLGSPSASSSSLAPKDDTGLSVSEAVFRAPLMVPGEFLESPELTPAANLGKIEHAVAGFSVPPPHHVLQTLPRMLMAALLSAKYVFVFDDTSIPSLAPLYCGPYLVLERQEKFFRLQVGSRTYVVSVNRLKPVFSADPISVDVPPAQGPPVFRPPDPVLLPRYLLAPLRLPLRYAQGRLFVSKCLLWLLFSRTLTEWFVI